MALHVAVQARGQAGAAGSFDEITRTVSVQANGGVVALVAAVERGQTFLLRHAKTQEERECRVLAVSPGQDRKKNVTFEFTKPAPKFWRMHFPTAESKS